MAPNLTGQQRELSQAEDHGLVQEFAAHVERMRHAVSDRLDARRREHWGQYLTPQPTAKLMAAMLGNKAEHISLLDAGAGIGSLSFAAVASLCSRLVPPKTISVTCYEVDSTLIPHLVTTLKLCERLTFEAGVQFRWNIIGDDFIKDVAHRLLTQDSHSFENYFTCAILNPPYRKIKSSSITSKMLESVGINVPNLYAAFVALALRVLTPGGQVVAITPRSFCNGAYFFHYRKMLIEETTIQHIHVFDSRDRVFSDDGVLQENVIISALKSNHVKPSPVTISVEEGDGTTFLIETFFDKVVRPYDNHKFIHLIRREVDEEVSAAVLELPATLTDLGLSVSTGKVVDFRVRDSLRYWPDDGTVPLIYPMHLVRNRIEWPKKLSKKANSILYNRHYQG